MFTELISIISRGLRLSNDIFTFLYRSTLRLSTNSESWHKGCGGTVLLTACLWAEDLAGCLLPIFMFMQVDTSYYVPLDTNACSSVRVHAWTQAFSNDSLYTVL